MPVFLSHRRTDSPAAVAIDRKLKQHGIRTYLDVLDPDLDTAQNITVQILKNLEPCTHLMAVISSTTAGSWWVPFEIGLATRGEKRISSFRTAAVALPEYLKVWPVLTTEADVEKFAYRYLKDGIILEKSFKFSEARASESRTPTDFHRLLKQDLGQR